ncbi:succinate dehydrogenase [ubiquinone] cytochrome b small subunit, mitochondrial [Contarinia nasturtii]|uniref:succinate dehydrogenase [ubiquinone] cytochrome b small subunit, mitochondrial n=1 Tax=Contarinia nasturtii TaxID=265458 RepID=UPI0012D3A38A|nr:succinate dehydrogenase [ubiquinone] cytochrome b small subunit, mitochondrial [Contarinia nasturtii]
MAMSVLLRSQNKFKAAATLSNVFRYSTSASKNSFKLLEHQNVSKFVFPKLNIAPVVKTAGIRQISLTATRQSAAGGSHSGLWTAERFVSLALLGIIPAALAFPSKTLDTLLAISVVMHAHWGIEACVVDYIRPVIFGPLIPKVAPLAVVAFSALLLGGLLYFIQTDIGIAQTVRKFWAIKGQ